MTITENHTIKSIVIPVHNRVATTEKCLHTLSEQKIFSHYNVYVVDDGSTDGTALMIRSRYPEVIVLNGDGDLYWGGAIAVGMNQAITDGAETIIWLNDDCIPDAGSIDKITSRAAETKGICGGVCYDKNREKTTYSGHYVTRESSSQVIPKYDEISSASILNGNIVAIHSDVVTQIGIVDVKEFFHYHADSWYTWKASTRGVIVEVHGGATAYNEASNYFDHVGLKISAYQGWKDLFRKGSPVYLKDHWRFSYSIRGFKGGLQALALIPAMMKYTLVSVRRGGIKSLLLSPNKKYSPDQNPGV